MILPNYKGSLSSSSGQIIATLHNLGPQNVAEEGKSSYFREIHIGEIL